MKVRCNTYINFVEINPDSLRKLDINLLKKVTTKLSVELPLQLSVPLISDESYWKKCCYMRWSDGQLGTFVKHAGTNLFQERKPSSIGNNLLDIISPLDEILLTGKFEGSKQDNSSPVDQALDPSKSWKQLYLERNLQEFLENMQSSRSLLQELHILEQDPDAENKDKNKFELEILQAAHDLSKIGKAKILKNPQEYEQAKRELEHFDRTGTFGGDIKQNGKTTNGIDTKYYSQLHSHRMRPNLNYYLIHANIKFTDDLQAPGKKKAVLNEEDDVAPKYVCKIDLPECSETFRERLKNLFDGSESRNASRLNHLTSDDDVFTFYNNAIYKSQYKHKDSGGDLQYWLLSKDDKNLSDGIKLFVKLTI